MFKLSLPTEDDFYRELIDDTHVIRVVGFQEVIARADANEKLARNHGVIASFSRALSAEGLLQPNRSRI